MRKAFLSQCCLSLLLVGAQPALAQRTEHTLNDGWTFDGQQRISLPHTWNTDAYTLKRYDRSAHVYERQLRLPADWDGTPVFLRLEAACQTAVVEVNGTEAARHQGGYTAFTADLTRWLRPGANQLRVTVDNADSAVPPVSADFTFMGGIYRDVWLVQTPRQHFDLTDHGSDGIRIVSTADGHTTIWSRVRNDGAEGTRLRLRERLLSPEGNEVATSDQTFWIQPGETRTLETRLPQVSRVQLWSPEQPVLYRVESVLTADDGTELERRHHCTAYRSVAFDGQRGFLLNGQPYKLRGVCLHQDQWPMGTALTDDQHRRDFRLMKEMGANFVRLAHYPQDESLLELCDREGMLVWEEIPVVNQVPADPLFADNCEAALRDMVRQHISHPSVILWGYMNEILLETQRLYKDDDYSQALVRTRALARRLEDALKEEDPSRPSVMAFHGTDEYNRTGLSQITDVVGWNLYSGWYGGDLSDFERFLDDQHLRYPAHPVIVSEYGAGSDRRLHTARPQAFDFSTEYQQRFVEHYLPVIERTPWLCGASYWNFVDFASAVRDESMPRINNKGLLTATRDPKDVYYYFQANWRADSPVLHVGRDQLQRTGTAGQRLPVKVYTNLPEVELLCNGTVVDTLQTDNCHAVCFVPLTEGRNVVTARGLWNGQPVEDAAVFSFQTVDMRQEVAVNVGSHCSFTSPDSRLTWLPDQPYRTGSWGYVGGEAKSTQSEMVGTTDDPLYQTWREGLQAYRFDVPAGRYELELLMADPHGNGPQPVYLLERDGQQVSNLPASFDVMVNDRPLAVRLTPAEEAGYNQALCRRYVVETREQGLTVAFLPRQGAAMLSAIHLRRLF